jgi:hypothetical protein
MKPLQLVDLMRLVATDTEPHAVLEKAYEWEHARWLEVGKWFLATGAAGPIALATLFSGAGQPATIVVIALSVVSTLAILSGLGAFWRARLISARYARVLAIAGELSEVKPFLQKLRKDGLL